MQIWENGWQKTYDVMNQIWENGKKLIFRPDFGPPIFFREFFFYQMWGIVASYHPMQFPGKCLIQTQENGENLTLGLIWAASFLFQKFGCVNH